MSWWEPKGLFESLEETILGAVDPCNMREFYKGAPYNPYEFLTSRSSTEGSNSSGTSYYWNDGYDPYDF